MKDTMMVIIYLVMMMTMKSTVEFVEHYKKKLMKLRNGLLVMTAELGIIGNIQTLWWNQSFIYV